MRQLQTLDLDVPPASAQAVEMVVTELADQVDLETGLVLARVGVELIDVADAEPVGPVTPRLTVAGAAVYVAAKRMNGKAVSQRLEGVAKSGPSAAD